jgi:hypothetical protein
MESRSAMNEVRFKVRQNALLWREFTAAQMMEITGLKPESVRTELQRMKTESLLEVGRTPCPADQKRLRGGQPVVYRLTSDPEKRLALSRSVEAFYPEVPQPQRPTSRHFALATRLLDQASTEKDAQKRERLLAEAEEELDFALAEEGAGRAPEVVHAYIEFQRGRVTYLRGRNNQEAENLFRQARQTLTKAGLGAEVVLIDEYLLCIEARHRWATEDSYRPETRARLLLEVLDEAAGQVGGPLLRLFVGLLNELSQTPYEQVIGAVVKQAVASGIATARVEDRISQYERPPSLQIDAEQFAVFVSSAIPMPRTRYLEEREFGSRTRDVSITPVHGFPARSRITKP